jgi:hypothetical protein
MPARGLVVSETCVEGKTSPLATRRNRRKMEVCGESIQPRTTCAAEPDFRSRANPCRPARPCLRTAPARARP